MSKDILIVNRKDLVAKRKSEHKDYEYVKYEVTPRKDFDQCYVAMYEIPPHKSNYPLHYHMANTETFYIISGCGVLDTGKEKRNIHTGDFIVCPPYECGAHKITNISDSEPLLYIDFDTTNSPDIIHYPDSDKTGIIIHNQSSKFFKNSSETQYYDGE